MVSADDGASWGALAAARYICRDTTFVVFCLSSLCIGFVYMQAMSTLPLHLLDSGMGPKTYGRLIALNGILIVCLQIPITAWVTRFHAGTMMVAGCVLTAIGFGLTDLATGAIQIAWTIVVWTLGEMCQAPLGPTIVSNLAPVALRGRYMGLFTTCFSSAMMLGVPIGGLVLERWGASFVWRGCFGVGMLAALLQVWVRRRLLATATPAPHCVGADAVRVTDGFRSVEPHRKQPPPRRGPGA